MSTFKLNVLELINETSFTLIGIHSYVEDYRLAFTVNKTLHLNLKRNLNDIEYNQATFSMFEWYNEAKDCNWELINNTYKTSKTHIPANNNLFNEENTYTKTIWLLPELKHYQYILKISNILHQDASKVLTTLRNSNAIQTAGSININTIKHKDILIFN